MKGHTNGAVRITVCVRSVVVACALREYVNTALQQRKASDEPVPNISLVVYSHRRPGLGVDIDIDLVVRHLVMRGKKASDSTRAEE